MNFMKNLTRGIIRENPTFVLVLGMCPTLAVTTSAINGMGMGLATMLVLIGSNVAISALRKVIPDNIRIPAFVVVIASFVTIVGMLMKAYVPALDAALGIFIPLIVVNCIILARAEAFAFSNGIADSFADAVGMGLGFTLALTVLGSIREILGAGSIFGFSLFGAAYEPVLLMILPPGAFLTLGLLIGLINWKTKKA
ncbi:electron transport complex subunit E [Acetobacterium wieringae]|uniref:Ion-translocating oxidoreductase complex subunit E n=1 Tax=Acetobacterium wieringae TaxID=52694 RepID=A0A1F2PH59_9FIRM|nr:MULTISPECIES: electron transport complex subunit E [Acetobacterium]OFV70657.1 electron transport complex subunit RnfE [Acetobacterium wieringae]OXS25569.1 MAG: electron transport complex subunit RsxE [Acetobacterium sp. MES1]TYC88319.1 electron transport complex subunit E [Acetobacterium wieringae]UYO61434.1 electron transport complex subunit E [Acetobacterium wieringae]VUZ28626.1 Electron transport complex subunit RnfE [Acetobacterium wieringae]